MSRMQYIFAKAAGLTAVKHNDFVAKQSPEEARAYLMSLRDKINSGEFLRAAIDDELDDFVDPVGDLYQTAFDGMHGIFGQGLAEHGSLAGHLHDAADKALVVFRDLLGAAVSAKAGDDGNDVDLSIRHAEHELGLLVSALGRAKTQHIPY